jgi:hypothetical protein
MQTRYGHCYASASTCTSDASPTTPFEPRPMKLLFPSLLLLSTLPTSTAQSIPDSGTWGFEIFCAQDAAGKNSLYMSSRIGSLNKMADLSAPPSRWLHRRRHMGPSEAPIQRDGIVFFIPLGDKKGAGKLAVADFRREFKLTELSMVSPTLYDPLVVPKRNLVLQAGDTGKGQTVIEIVSYATPGAPAKKVWALILDGAPAGGVTRMLLDGDLVLVPTTTGIHVLRPGKGSKPYETMTFVKTLTRSPITNLVAFPNGTSRAYACMTCNYVKNHRPLDAAVTAFEASGKLWTMKVGNVPNTSPPKPYVPAAGFHEPGVVSKGGISFIGFLLREREPGTGFTKPAGVAVAGFGMPNGPTFAIAQTLPQSGEPFAEIAVHGTRMAFMTSQSPKWWPNPKGGSEVLNILYTPLDPVGANTIAGVIGTAGPLGGRIGIEVTDRPLWSHDGRHLFVTTVNYPGAPNPGKSGSELLGVPAKRAVNPKLDKMLTLLELGDQSSERAYGLPTRFDPWDLPAAAFGESTMFGQYTQTAAHSVLVPHKIAGNLGARTLTARKLPRDKNIPGFPSIPPRTFDDVNGSIVAPPKTYGARRAGFNLWSRTNSMLATYLVQAEGNELIYQISGINTLGFGNQIPTLTISLPTGSITTTEILTL